MRAQLTLINGLVDAGIKRLEATAFVSPKWVPQMSDASLVMDGIKHLDEKVEVSVLAPNLKGLERARVGGRVDVVSVFGAGEFGGGREDTRTKAHNTTT